MCMYIYIKQDVALYNLQKLIFHKTKPIKIVFGLEFMMKEKYLFIKSKKKKNVIKI